MLADVKRLLSLPSASSNDFRNRFVFLVKLRKYSLADLKLSH